MNAGHHPRSRLAGALLALVFLVAPVLLTATPALADSPTDTEACFLSKINAARSSTGAQPLARDATLAGYARTHSQAMAANGGIYHSSTGDLAPYLPTDWMMWGENVGVGGTCAVLFNAFMASPHHKENLLNPAFQYAGIGDFVDSNGTLWTTHVFLQRQTTSTTQPPTTTTTQAPTTSTTTPPATTTTTQAPTTTTTAPPTTAVALPPTTSTAPPSPTTTTTTTTTTTEALAALPASTTTQVAPEAPPSGPNVAGSLTAAIRGWQSRGVLCNDPECGGDQVLLAFIGALLLSGSAITTWALRA